MRSSVIAPEIDACPKRVSSPPPFVPAGIVAHTYLLRRAEAAASQQETPERAETQRRLQARSRWRRAGKSFQGVDKTRGSSQMNAPLLSASDSASNLAGRDHDRSHPERRDRDRDRDHGRYGSRSRGRSNGRSVHAATASAAASTVSPSLSHRSSREPDAGDAGPMSYRESIVSEDTISFIYGEEKVLLQRG